MTRRWLPRHAPLHPPIRLLLAGAALASLTFGTGALQAGSTPGWRVGEPATVPLRVPAAEAETARASAADLARRLGLPGAAAPLGRALDRTIGRVIDTVELLGPDGHTAAIVARDAAGNLRSAIRLAWSADLDAPRTDAPSAATVARRFATLAGLRLPAVAPATSWDAGMDAWRLRWPRVVDGVPVPTDGIVAWIHRGAQLKALSVFESRLAAAPPRQIAPTAASDAARAYIARNGIDRMAGLTIEVPTLAWAEANDFVDPALPDAPAATLRLAWVVRFSYVPTGWTERHVVELHVDAGSGQLMGGAETA